MITNKELQENLDRVEAQVRRNRPGWNKPEDEIIEAVTLPWDYLIKNKREQRR